MTQKGHTPKSPHPRSRLRNKMLMLVLGAAVGVFLVLMLVTWREIRGLMVRELKQVSRTKVALASNWINQNLHKKMLILQTLAERQLESPEGWRFNRDYFTHLTSLYKSEGIVSIYMGYEGGGYATGGGWTPPPSFDHHRRPWYLEAKRAGKPIYTKPYVDARTGKNLITLAIPLYAKRKLIAVMAMDVFITEIIKMVNSLHIGEAGRAYLVNDEGLYLSHWDPQLVLSGNIRQTAVRSIFEQFLSGAGEATRTTVYEAGDYVVVSRIATPAWNLFFHLPSAQVNRPLKKLTLMMIITIVVGILALALAIFIISHRITRPILSLAGGASKIAGGDYDLHLKVLSRNEIGHVTRCFNEMAVGLKEREFIKSTFGRYVSQDVMHDILSGNIELGGQKVELSILFSHIRGFAEIAGRMDPMELVRLLNAYFTRMDEAISQGGGSINKYMGDGILALFGAPRKLDHPTVAAVESALSKIEALGEFNHDQGTSLTLSIGVHTGEVVVGNIGSEQRTEYTVIGDSVNLTSRVEALSRFYGVSLLITDSAAEHLDESWLLMDVDRVRVKGKNHPVSLYRPYRQADLSEEARARTLKINHIMTCYYEGDFPQAITLMEALESPLNEHMNLIRERCIEFVATPPTNWSGVYTMKVK